MPGWRQQYHYTIFQALNSYFLTDQAKNLSQTLEKDVLMAQSNLEAKVMLCEWHDLTQIWNISLPKSKNKVSDQNPMRETLPGRYSIA